MPAYHLPLTPPVIEEAITRHLELQEEANDELYKLDQSYHDAQADYDVEFSRAVIRSRAPNAEARRAEAIVETEPYKRRADEAKVIRDHQKRKVQNISEAIGALRTLAANTRGMS